MFTFWSILNWLWYVFGNLDIDGRQLRGVKGCNIASNVAQYQLQDRVLDTIVCDLAHHPWRQDTKFDAIVCDPPYGVRAGAKKIALNPNGSLPERKKNGEIRYPYTVEYEMDDLITDLITFAAIHLSTNGRLVFWLPTLNDKYEPTDIPTHLDMRLIANSEQVFGKWSRRLITMQKIADSNSKSNATQKDSTGHTNFRLRYFESNKSSN